MVYFAEFPNLLYPAMPKAPSLGLLMRFSVRNAKLLFFTLRHSAGTPQGALRPPAVSTARRSHVRETLDRTENPTPASRPQTTQRTACTGILACFPFSLRITRQD